MERLGSSNKTVGVKQTKRAIRDGTAALVFISGDAEERVTQPVRALCAESGVPVKEAESMAALGSACGIDIGAAVAALLR
ncbi:MAG: ribosomal L7Ae/L30e/S12e/Gadd45 family protein [Oscillospiraceae bacterium]|jgi:large subunit ribosomal protein L7A|nr:ribosomal L7Ae/L30e/S12e/Gadd45 family protein [Oscillospiraceae bacterium]